MIGMDLDAPHGVSAGADAASPASPTPTARRPWRAWPPASRTWLRNPLAVVLARVQLLQLAAQRPDGGADKLERASRRRGRAGAARVEGHREPVELRAPAGAGADRGRRARHGDARAGDPAPSHARPRPRRGGRGPAGGEGPVGGSRAAPDGADADRAQRHRGDAVRRRAADPRRPHRQHRRDQRRRHGARDRRPRRRAHLRPVLLDEAVGRRPRALRRLRRSWSRTGARSAWSARSRRAPSSC